MQFEKNKEMSDRRLAELNQRFKVADPVLQKFIDQVRAESSMAMLIYMIESSPPSLFLSIVCRLALAVRNIPPKNMFSTVRGVRARKVVEEYAFGA
jgi:hypothetical protein